MYTEKVYYDKMVNQMMDLIVFSFFQLVVKTPDYDVHALIPDLKQKIKELKEWIERKAVSLSFSVKRGSETLDQAYQANRNDTFAIGAKRKSMEW